MILFNEQSFPVGVKYGCPKHFSGMRCKKIDKAMLKPDSSFLGIQ